MTKLIGCTEARLWTPPLKPLNRSTSMGFEVIDFARSIGEPLLPWQEWAAIHALEIGEDGNLRYRKVLIKVARQNGKSNLKRMVSLWRMYKYPGARILGVAQDVSLAREQMQYCIDTIEADPDMHAEWGGRRNVNGDERFWLASGSLYRVKAANRRAGRGGSNDEANIDELREQYDWDAWAAVSKTTNARRNGQTWAMTNEGDDRSTVLNQLTDVADAGTDELLCRLEWSAPPGCEIDDTEAWRHANPALGYLITEATIRSDSKEPAEVFRPEVLCQRVANTDAAIDQAGWKACADPAGTMDGLRDRIALVIDTAETGHTTLTAAAVLDDRRVRLEVVQAWDTPHAALDDLADLTRLIKPRAAGWFPRGHAAEIGPGLRAWATEVNRRNNRKRRPGDPPDNGEITGQREAEACMSFAGLVKARRLLHPDDDLLNAHAAAAQKTPAADGWRFTRRPPRKGAPPMPVDAATAAAGAAELALTLPVPRTGRIRVLGA